MDRYGEMVLKNAKPDELAKKTIDIQQMKEWYKSPIMIIILTYIEIYPIGILVSLIAAFRLRKKAN